MKILPCNINLARNAVKKRKRLQSYSLFTELFQTWDNYVKEMEAIIIKSQPNITNLLFNCQSCMQFQKTGRMQLP